MWPYQRKKLSHRLLATRTATAELTAPTAVGSGDWLGIMAILNLRVIRVLAGENLHQRRDNTKNQTKRNDESSDKHQNLRQQIPIALPDGKADVNNNQRSDAQTNQAHLLLLILWMLFPHKRSMLPTKTAEPPPTRDVNRDSGNDRAIGGWLR